MDFRQKVDMVCENGMRRRRTVLGSIRTVGEGPVCFRCGCSLWDHAAQNDVQLFYSMVRLSGFKLEG